MTGIAFLCVANSARSQMAEGIARAVAPAGVSVYSAGSAPSQVNPMAVRAMAEIGIDLTEHRSKSVDDLPLDQIDLIVTLCAEEVCPVVPGSVKRLHWPLPDPAGAGGSDDDVLDAFRRVRDELRNRIPQLF